MEKVITLQTSPLPVKTWRYLKVNKAEIAVPEKLQCNAKSNISLIDSNIERISQKTLFEKLNPKEIEGSLGKDFNDWFVSQNIECNVLNLSSSDDDKVYHVVLNVKDNDDYAGIFVINAKENAKGKVLFEIVSDNEDTSNSKTDAAILTEGAQLPAGGTVCLYVLCNTEKNANIELSEVQLLNESKQFISNTIFTQSESSKAMFTRCNFGSQKSYVGLKTTLQQNDASFESRLAYITHKTQFLDINDLAVHVGKKTQSDFITQGVMLGSSYKNYKGTIDLQKGCTGSLGNELEDVLLLSDDVINKTTPIILCSEEDVQGNHGATLGKINDDVLFYMNSRGLSSELAKQMIAKGKLYKILLATPNEKLIESANNYLNSAFKI